MLTATTRLGPYEIVSPLGAGGMGEVYRARDTRLGREVAVKVLPESLANDAGSRARFEREARAVAALSHPNILSIHDYGTHDSVTFAVMELLEGETLRGRLSKGPLPWREVIEIGAATADGLAAAHVRGIVHRDLKPENLFLTTDGRVKILDFGLARVTQVVGQQSQTAHYDPVETHAGVVMGTVGYMSPEQVRGQPAEAASDVFSLGCVLQELITGQRAFRRDSAVETMNAILHDEPAELSVAGQPIPEELSRVIGQCLMKRSLDRVPSARDLAIALRATASSLNVLTVSPQKVVEAVAVLPFENVGGDPKTEYLSDGLADHLIISLSQVRRDGLKVRPFSSVFRYKLRQPEVLTIGRELKVQVLVTGTLHLSADGLWIGVALVDAREDNQLWGKRYHGKLGQILDLQDEIARDVAANLRLRLTGEEEQRLTKRYTEDPEAYLLYREATYHFNKFTQTGLETSIDYCRRALQRDQNYAVAYVGLGRCYQVLGSIYRGFRQTQAEADSQYHRALAIDAALAEAHSGLACLRMMRDWDWSAGKAELEQAIAIDPTEANAWEIDCFRLAALGRLPEAYASLKHALELDPFSARTGVCHAMCLNWMRLYDRAIAESQRTLALDPHFPLAYPELALALVATGKHADAIAELHKALGGSHNLPRVTGMLGYACAAAGKRAEALQVLNEMRTDAADRFGYAFPIARIHAALGERNQAFDWLRKACEERDSAVIWLKVDPTMDALRPDPRFAQVLRDMGLPPETDSQFQPPLARNSSRLVAWVLVALALAAVLATAGYLLKPDNKGSNAGAPVSETKPVEALAVLPFDCTEGDETTEMLSETLAGHISDSLRQVGRRDLKIRPPSSVSRYTKQRPDTLTIGRELNVPLIVTGMMRSRGNDLTITVEVVDAREDNLLWRKPYTCQRGERLDLDVQDQIVQDVAANLGLRLSDDEQRRLTRRRTADRDAYDLYRETMVHLNKFTPEGITAGIKSGKQAIEKDPKFALVYSAVARCYLLRGTLYDGPKKTFPEARTYVDEALKLDPELPDAHSALAMISFFHDWDWPAAEHELQRAIALDPSVPLTWNFQGFWLAAHGRLPEALAAIRRGQALDPLSPGRRSELAMCYDWMGNHAQAIVEAEKVLELDPNFPLAYRELGLAYIQKKMPEKAIAVLQEAIDRGQRHPRVLGMLGCAYVAAERREEAQRVLDELRGLSQNRFGFAFPIAQIHAALGETDAAFPWLQKALDERDSMVVWLKVDPTMDNLRTDLRFAERLKEMHLPP